MKKNHANRSRHCTVQNNQVLGNWNSKKCRRSSFFRKPQKLFRSAITVCALFLVIATHAFWLGVSGIIVMEDDIVKVWPTDLQDRVIEIAAVRIGNYPVVVHVHTCQGSTGVCSGSFAQLPQGSYRLLSYTQSGESFQLDWLK